MNVALYEPRYRGRGRGRGLLNRLLSEDLGQIDFDNLLAREPDLAADWTPAVDISEETDHYLLTADLPGVKPDDIEITMENGILTLQGQRDEEQRSEAAGYKRYERIRGSFLRRFALPDIANGEDIEAETKHGVLELKIPKRAELAAKKIAVKQA